MKDNFWNLSTALVMFLTLIIGIVFLMIFMNPYSFFNPYPPRELPSILKLPTTTATFKQLPEVWTPTPLSGINLDNSLTQTKLPSSTLYPTGTSFRLPTSTATRTLTPSVTVTGSATVTGTATATDRPTAVPTNTTGPTSTPTDTPPPTETPAPTEASTATPTNTPETPTAYP